MVRDGMRRANQSARHHNAACASAWLYCEQRHGPALQRSVAAPAVRADAEQKYESMKE